MRKWISSRKIKKLIFIFILPFAPVFSQEFIDVKGIIGTCYIINTTPEEAKFKAIENAKIDALRAAGIKESVFESNTMFSNNTSERSSFGSYSNISLNGTIIDYSVTNERKFIDDFNNLTYEVTIDAKIIKRDSPKVKPFWIGSFKSNYRNGESFTFKAILPNQWYFYAFVVDENKMVNQLFPNSFEIYNQFNSYDTISFPISKNIKYDLYTSKDGEINMILFLLCERKVQFGTNTLTNFIYSLNAVKPDQINIQTFGIVIQK